MLLGVLIWNRIIDKDKREEPTIVDNDDVNNVKIVDGKLNGEDYRITQSYLRTYTVHKAGMWYYSSGYVKKIKYNNDNAIISLSKDKNSNDVIITAARVFNHAATVVYNPGSLNTKLE